jgi:hypothetical protein
MKTSSDAAGKPLIRTASIVRSSSTSVPAKYRYALELMYRSLEEQCGGDAEVKFRELTNLSLHAYWYVSAPMMLPNKKSVRLADGSGSIPLPQGTMGIVVDSVEIECGGIAFTFPVIRIYQDYRSEPFVDVVAKHANTAIWINGPLMARERNWPLNIGRLDWECVSVITVHSSQGLEFEYGIVHLGSCFDWHMALVAITRFFDCAKVRVAGGEVPWDEFDVHPLLKKAVAMQRAASISAMCSMYASMKRGEA